ncbi:Hypothetical protein, putative [Bodo saltans]|uniref:Transmembrane protein n=1 Tax=Bodo saltans TaxID=75058 RepID=A0A0S4IY50_BODSA|nr:Hypothetical protein, putative [Bodo saltans]|eukprot:CUG15953.1 Hypothetical protein, putative [Bodo saltans]
MSASLSKKEIRRICRNALYAAGLRVVVGVLKALLKRGFSGLRTSLLSEILSLDPWKWAGFVGGLSSIRNFESVLSKSLNPIAASVVAGLIAASPVVVFQEKTQTELMLYFLARVVHNFGANFVLPQLPQAFQDFSHYDVLTMMVASSEILYSFVFLPKCHLPSYQGFLLRATMTDSKVIAATAAAHRCTPCPEGVEYAMKRNIAFDPRISDTSKVCNLWHPGQTCSSNSVSFLTNHFLRITFPLYLPLKVISTVALNGRKLVNDPVPTLVKCVKSSAKSATFLTVYCAAATRIICVFAQLGIRNDVGIALIAGCVSGATTLIEDKARRLDLAIYCLMQAIRSTTLLMYHKGYCSLPRRSSQVVLYLTCVAYLFAFFARSPSQTHPTVAKMFSMLSGEKKAGDKKEVIQ